MRRSLWWAVVVILGVAGLGAGLWHWQSKDAGQKKPAREAGAPGVGGRPEVMLERMPVKTVFAQQRDL